MPGSMIKFFGEQGAQHGGRLIWPGTAEGLPLRSDTVPLTRQDEYEELPVVADFHARWLDMAVPEDHALFCEIMSKKIVGWYLVSNRQDHFDENTKQYRIWLEWYQLYGAPNPGAAYARHDR